MLLLKRLFDFYLQASIHVALAVYVLVLMTQHQFALPYNIPVALFAFFGTIVAYNFVKYDALARVRKSGIRKIKIIALVSLFSFLGAAFFFFKLAFITQIVSVVFLLLTMLYTLPFFPNRKNARNWAGVKIYIVALCWVGVTVLLPLLNAEIALSADIAIKSIQRFLLVFVLILIFEIIDLPKDDPHLQTVPQQIGTKATKYLGVILMLVFYVCEFFLHNIQMSQLIINAILVIILSLMLLFANPARSKYYSSFFTESIPIFWWLLLILF